MRASLGKHSWQREASEKAPGRKKLDVLKDQQEDHDGHGVGGEGSVEPDGLPRLLWWGVWISVCVIG